jgi:hypothetical protein
MSEYKTDLISNKRCAKVLGFGGKTNIGSKSIHTLLCGATDGTQVLAYMLGKCPSPKLHLPTQSKDI